MLPLLVSLAAHAADFTHPAAQNVHFTVALRCGSIAFRNGGEGSVTLSGDFGDSKPMFEGSEKELRFVVPPGEPHRMWGRNEEDCDLLIDARVPQGASIDASSTNGNITLNEIHGVLVLETVNGNITVLDPGPEIRVTAVNGNVDVDDLRGEAELTTVNGNITLDAKDIDDLRTQTVNGNTQVRSGKVRRLRSQTVQGDIVFSGTVGDGSRLEFESHAGDISLRIPTDPGYVLALESFSGEIENHVNGTAPVTAEFGPGTHLDTTVGSGAARIEAQSFSGDIVIEPPKK
jgi:hypothetical protein